MDVSKQLQGILLIQVILSCIGGSNFPETLRKLQDGSQYVPVKFSNPVNNNLGGVGPNLNDPAEIRFENGWPDEPGLSVTLETESTLYPSTIRRNGLHSPDFARIQFRLDESLKLKVKFSRTGEYFVGIGDIDYGRREILEEVKLCQGDQSEDLEGPPRTIMQGVDESSDNDCSIYSAIQGNQFLKNFKKREDHKAFVAFAFKGSELTLDLGVNRDFYGIKKGDFKNTFRGFFLHVQAKLETDNTCEENTWCDQEMCIFEGMHKRCPCTCPDVATDNPVDRNYVLAGGLCSAENNPEIDSGSSVLGSCADFIGYCDEEDSLNTICPCTCSLGRTYQCNAVNRVRRFNCLEEDDGSQLISLRLSCDIDDPTKDNIREAAARWNGIIQKPEETVTLENAMFYSWNDIAEYDACLANDTSISGVKVFFSIQDLGDGPLAVAGVLDVTTNNKPVVGFVNINKNYLDSDPNREEVVDVLVHELGHVLGIGTLWDITAPAEENSNGDWVGSPEFTGQLATQEYQALSSDNTATGVPVEDGQDADGSQNGFGEGSVNGHWDTSAGFEKEIMSARISSEMILSNVTLKALTDMGYTVDLTKAETFSLDTNRRLSSRATSDYSFEGDVSHVEPVILHKLSDGKFAPVMKNKLNFSINN